MDLEQYIIQGEPGRKERAENWQVAIGLQAVDGLKPSHYLLQTAQDHIEERISNDGWRVIGTQAYANARFLYYINEIRSVVLVMHGAEAHSRYFGEAAYHYMVEGKAEGYNFAGKPNPNPENKHLLIIPGATHCDLYDGGEENYIPWDTLADFFIKNL